MDDILRAMQYHMGLAELSEVYSRACTLTHTSDAKLTIFRLLFPEYARVNKPRTNELSQSSWRKFSKRLDSVGEKAFLILQKILDGQRAPPTPCRLERMGWMEIRAQQDPLGLLDEAGEFLAWEGEEDAVPKTPDREAADAHNIFSLAAPQDLSAGGNDWGSIDMPPLREEDFDFSIEMLHFSLTA
ncbi:MAG: hypothetical protein Q9224_007579 [Gallowayella concinna]